MPTKDPKREKTMKLNRRLVYEKYNGKCAYCGHDLDHKFQIDHCIPKERFLAVVSNKQAPSHLSHLDVSDVNHFDNLMPSCFSCNNYKNVFLLEEFRNQIGLLLNRLNSYTTIYRISKRYGLVKEEPKSVVFYFEQLQEQGL